MIRCSLLHQYDIGPGDRRDFMELADSHYRAGPPATIELVLCARARATRRLAGVLTVSRPVLNASWRAIAWPEHFGPATQFLAAPMSERARVVNELVRCISRVIIDERDRGVGLSTALVRAYLRDPLTELTEGIAAMAGACPFFASAGMRRVDRPPARRERALMQTLRELRVPARVLMEPRALTARAIGEGRAAAVERAVRRWARDSRASRASGGASMLLLGPLAGVALLSERAAFVYPGQASTSPAFPSGAVDCGLDHAEHGG